jgi:ABC-type cobalamin/Fe3+-siderophores transport system ATPase subunit
MKFRKISFENHPILGNMSFDFTDKDGRTVDTIIIAGENGCGKSVLLNELYQYNPAYIVNKEGIIITEIELSQYEKETINGSQNFKRHALPLIAENIITINQDFSIQNSWEQCKVQYHCVEDREITTNGNILILNNDILFKPIFSDVEINFTPNNIKTVTSSNIDEKINSAIKSSNNIATEITQLLIDIDSSDNSDLAVWVKNNPGIAPPYDVQSTRMKRFTNAFHSIFPGKRFVEINNKNGHKTVEFEEFGKRMPIEKLSSGEKQIVFRGGFLLRNQKTTEGSVVLIDEPEISLHPKWQLEIMTFLKNLFMKDGKQTSQLIVATHSPFIIHNATRANDKVIVMKKNNDGTITICQDPKYYSWTEAQIVKEAFNITPYLETGKINVFLEGETDEKYYNKAMDVFGIDKDKISFKWIGRNTEKGKAENTGDSALNNAVLFFKANPSMAIAPLVMFYDCDTNKPVEDDNDLHIRTMNRNDQNTLYKKGVENLLVLPDDFEKDQFYSTKETTNDYGCFTKIQTFDKMKLCDYLCSLENDKLQQIFANLNTEIQQLLSIK